MPHSLRGKPHDSLKDHFIIKDGLLWWNPALKEFAPRRKYDRPIGLGRNTKFPTVRVDDEVWHIHRLNYWMHTDEWPQAVIFKKEGSFNLHIDNLVESNFSDIRSRAKTDERTYMIREVVTKAGITKFYASICLDRKKRHIGVYSDEAKAIEAAKAMRWLLFHSNNLPEFFLSQQLENAKNTRV